MPRRTRHRRRFHTDRIVAKRRARYLREEPVRADELISQAGLAKRLSYGALANRDPWDCGHPLLRDLPHAGTWPPRQGEAGLETRLAVTYAEATHRPAPQASVTGPKGVNRFVR